MSRPSFAEQNVGIGYGLLLLVLLVVVSSLAGCTDTRSATVVYAFGSPSCRQCLLDKPRLPRGCCYIDVNRYRDFANLHNVRRLPTYIIVQNGKVVYRTHKLDSLKQWQRR